MNAGVYLIRHVDAGPFAWYERDVRNLAGPRFWNPWWTLTWIAAALTVLVAVLEYLGAFDDLGVVLTIVGVVLTVVFGLAASTRSSVSGFRAEIVPTLERIDQGFRAEVVPALERIDQGFRAEVVPVLERIDQGFRAEVVPALERIDQEFRAEVVPVLERIDHGFRSEIAPVLERIERLLAERLPPR
jgi:hypothetical protein